MRTCAAALVCLLSVQLSPGGCPGGNCGGGRGFGRFMQFRQPVTNYQGFSSCGPGGCGQMVVPENSGYMQCGPNGCQYVPVQRSYLPASPLFAPAHVPAKRCRCSSECSCGCQQGQPCQCSGSALEEPVSQQEPLKEQPVEDKIALMKSDFRVFEDTQLTMADFRVR